MLVATIDLTVLPKHHDDIRAGHRGQTGHAFLRTRDFRRVVVAERHLSGLGLDRQRAGLAIDVEQFTLRGLRLRLCLREWFGVKQRVRGR